MIKHLLITALLFIGYSSLQAQTISENALGVRIGDNKSLGAEISYQRGLGGNTRMELDLGWRNSDNVDVIKLAGLYQWVFKIDKGLNWYVGAGGGIGSSSNENGTNSFFFVAGDIGIEYNFDAPILLSLDFRPEFGFSDFNDDLGFDIGLGIRYQF